MIGGGGIVARHVLHVWGRLLYGQLWWNAVYIFAGILVHGQGKVGLMISSSSLRRDIIMVVAVVPPSAGGIAQVFDP